MAFVEARHTFAKVYFGTVWSAADGVWCEFFGAASAGAPAVQGNGAAR
jgi:hypothetical protein